MRNAQKLLQLAAKDFPMPDGKSHSFTLRGDQMVLTLIIKEQFQCFGIDERDLDSTSDGVWDQIKHLLAFNNE